MVPQLVLVAAAVLAAWHPPEVYPVSAVVLAVAALVMVPWAWSRTSARGFRRALAVGSLWVVFLFAGQAGGWDRSEAVAELFLITSFVLVLWIASREAPTEAAVIGLALALAALAFWGISQSLGGLESMRAEVQHLPEHLQEGAIARIDQRRAFASLLLPSHLAAVLAMVLPLLIGRIRSDLVGWLCAALAAVACLGVVATRSPVGGGLAVAACCAVLAAAHRRRFVWIGAVASAAAVVVTGLRPDVLELEPIALRIDNWSAAIWTWWTSPVIGAGLGSFGQAAQAVPWEMGNRPLHAHNLPLEWLAELGIVGLAVCVLLACMLVKLVRDLWPRHPGLAAALLVPPVHNLVDFSMYSSAVLLPWGLLVAWSVALVKQEKVCPARCAPRRWRALPVVAASVAVALSVVTWTSQLLLDAARSEEDPEESFLLAKRSVVLAPWRAEPVEVLAVLALDARDRQLAELAAREMRAAFWQRPRSANRELMQSQLDQLTGDSVGGVVHLWSSTTLRPFDRRTRRAFEEISARMQGRQP